MKHGRYFLLSLVLIPLYLALYQLPSYGDWAIFYQAAQLPDPYTHPAFLVPPWAVIALRPFILLPEHAAGAAWVTVSLVIILYSLHKMDADRTAVLLTLFNPFMWFFLTLGQLDALVLLGFAINYPPLDILLITIKPHVIGTAVIAKLRHCTRQQWLWLVTAVILSLLIWWNWPVRMVSNWHDGVYHPLSFDVFPYGVPVGLAALYYGWKRSNPAFLALATYFLTPYVGPGSIIVYAAIVFSKAHTAVRVALFLLLWVIALYLLT